MRLTLATLDAPDGNANAVHHQIHRKRQPLPSVMPQLKGDDRMVARDYYAKDLIMPWNRRYCATCDTIWCRDKSACINMHLLVMFYLQQPLHFDAQGKPVVPGQSEERLTRHGQSYSFMTWSTRSQEWAAALFLTFVFPGTLLPVSIFSLAATATTILVSPLTVGLIDSFPRLPVTLSALSAQKLAIALAAGLLWARHGSFGSLPAAGDAADRTFRADAGYVVVVLAGCVLALASSLATLRRIDLVCKLAAPLFVSVVAAAGTVPIAMAAVAGQSLTTMVLEWILLVRVHAMVPQLAAPRGEAVAAAAATSEPNPTNAAAESEAVEIQPIQRPGQTETAQQVPNSGKRTSALQRTLGHQVFPTIVAIAQVYLTALAYGGPMVSYLLNRGYSQTLLAILRGASVVFGLLATVTSVTKLAQSLGPVRLGLWGVWQQTVCLAPAVLSFWVSPNLASSSAWLSPALFFGGVTLSRWGLWTFDLAQMQIFQERQGLARRLSEVRGGLILTAFVLSVAEIDVGLLSGVQLSLQNVFDLLGYVTTIIWHNPDDFWIPAVISFGAVLSAAITFSAYARKVRGHLVHMDRVARLFTKKTQ
ncbi:hypothetical protein HK105_201020 [Polyrhizophydium stewartii]|uniref:Solute carrier family 40 member n=1 Tax=Polyrhizophydium stewartii TaxID=2732419 RepID=A0ABR4NIP6_9FUNG